MAQVSSGSFNTSSYNGRYLTFNWSVDNTNIPNNYKEIYWSLIGHGGSGYHMAGNFKVVIDGEVVYEKGQDYRIELWNGTVVASGYKKLYHNTTGNKSFSASVEAGIFTYARNVSGSGSWELPTIPRYGTSNQSLRSKTETTININWSSDNTVDYIWFSKDNGSTWTGVDVTDGTSGWYGINGLSPNTTYNIKTRIRRKDSQLTTDSSTLNVTTYKVPTQSFKSKTETTVDVNWSCDSTADYIWTSADNGANWYVVGAVNGTSGTYTIRNQSPNSTINIKTRVRRKDTQTTYDTSSMSVTTYDYPYCTESPNFIIGDLVTLKFYNPLNRTFNFYIIANGTQIEAKWENKSGTSYTGLNSTWDTVPQLYATIPNAKSGKYQVKVVYGDSTKIRNNGNTYSIKGTEVPTFSNFTYKDSNTNVTEITGNNQVLVKGKSTLQVTISSANKMTANNSAKPKNYKATIDTLNKSVDYSTGDINLVVGTVVNSGAKRLTVTAYDTRTLSKSIYKDITVYDYNKPVINASITRRNKFEAETTLKVNGSYSRLNIGGTDKNTVTTVKYRYRQTGGTWGDWITLNKSVDTGKFTCDNVILSLDNTKSFEFQVQAVDKLDATTKTLNLDKGKALFFISTNKEACYTNGDFEVNGDFKVNGNSNLTGDLVLEKFEPRVSVTNGTRKISLHVGTGGINRGIWDDEEVKWLLHYDGQNVYANNVNISNIYSTNEEIRIGTWIDGKPLYRKVYKFTFENLDNDVETNATLMTYPSYVDFLKINTDFKFTNSSGAYYFVNGNYMDDSLGEYARIYSRSTEKSIRLMLKGWDKAEIYLTLEYTKTTD